MVAHNELCRDQISGYIQRHLVKGGIAGVVKPMLLKRCKRELSLTCLIFEMGEFGC